MLKLELTISDDMPVASIAVSGTIEIPTGRMAEVMQRLSTITASAPEAAPEPVKVPRRLGRKNKPGATWEVPDDLRELPLYAGCHDLCDRWNVLKDEWSRAFPGVDIMAAAKASHAWQSADPKRKKCHQSAFLAGWLMRNQERAARPAGRDYVTLNKGQSFDQALDLEDGR